MKVKFQKVTPISFDQKLFEKVNRVIDEGVEKSLHTMSFDEQKKLLNDYKHVLARFIENVSNNEEEFVRNGKSVIKKIVHFEKYSDVKQKHSTDFMKRLKKALMKGNCVAPAGNTETVLYNNNRLDSLDLTNTKQVFDVFPKDENDRVEACANVDERNKVFIFNGCFDEASSNVVPISQIVAWVDLNEGVINENDKFIPKRSKAGEHVDSVLDYKFMFDEVKFNLPCDLEQIKAEFDEPYDMRIEPFDDVFNESKRFFKSYFDKSNQNKPSNSTLKDSALEIMEQLEYVTEAMEQYEIKQNNLDNLKMTNEIFKDMK